MGTDDFQIIVDYVKDNISSDYLDSYGTSESYYGAGAYYTNFDTRAGNFDSDVFETWEDAIIEGLQIAYLPNAFPDAETQVNGVDVFYTINFDIYSGVDGNYTIKFQCTTAGPNPEFTLIEGPY